MSAPALCHYNPDAGLKLGPASKLDFPTAPAHPPTPPSVFAVAASAAAAAVAAASRRQWHDPASHDGITTTGAQRAAVVSGRLELRTDAKAKAAATATFLVTTLRGNTAEVDVPLDSTYDDFVRLLLARSRDRDCPDAAVGAEDDGDEGLLPASSEDGGGNAGKWKARSSATEESAFPTGQHSQHHSLSSLVMVIHEGKVLTEDSFRRLLLRRSEHVGAVGAMDDQHDNNSTIYVSLKLRLLGGMADRQNRVGSKFGGGGQASGHSAERDRKERLRQLALESVDLAKDPYLMRNHLGTYECKLCLTLHTNEGNYLAHTQGKKHQAGLARRAAMEKKLAPTLPAAQVVASPHQRGAKRTRVRIGRPGYEISKSRDPSTDQRCLSFTLHYPEADETEDGIVSQPRHRFMSAYEQRVESPDKRYQYLLVACEPYETVAFKIPNEPIDKGEGRFVTNWDEDGRKFTLTLYFVDPKDK